MSNRKFYRKIKLNPAQTIVIGFVAVILFGTLLFCLPICNTDGKFVSFIDSFFMSASAVCVTGFSAVSTGYYFTPFGQVVLLFLIQLGGLGFMTATTFVMILIGKKISFKDRVAIRDSLSEDSNKGIIKLVKKILIFTFSVEILGALILLPVFCMQNGAVGIWQAFFTSVSAFCNAGYDIFGASSEDFSGLTGYVDNSVVSITVSALLILGGLGFAVIMDVINKRGRFKKFTLHSKVVISVSAILLVAGWIFFFAVEFSNPETIGGESLSTKLLASFFQSATSRTAGFYTINQNGLHKASKFFSDILMFIGASPGSTGGGIKTTTIAILFFTVVSGLRNRDSVVVGKYSINYKTVYKSISVFIMAITLIFFLTLLLLLTEKNTMPAEFYSFDNILHDAFSAFSTAGMSTGIIPHLTTVGKIAIIVTMLVGRIGFIPIGLMFVSANNVELIKYPDGNLPVG